MYFDTDYINPNTNLPIALLKSDNFISKYQGYLYEIGDDGFIDDNNHIVTEALGEYFSEGYKEYIMNPKRLQRKDIDLYEFIKELK
ncbi:hypothetical protein EWI07_07590 [Sporolactobacillus sp. THM7-4]|nr:hypothetical protein EWI07_07590 [Sporolactobacillus sp. THM7-4]